MKKIGLLFLVAVFAVSMVGFGIGCKTTASTSTAAETTAAETSTAETTKAEETTTAAEGEKVQVTIFGWLTSYAKPFSEKFKELVAKKYPNIELVFQESTYEDAGTQYLLKAQSGDVPDVAYCELIMANELGNVGALEDLSQFLDPKVISDLPESVYNSCLFDGKLVSIMWDISPYALFTSSSLATKAGFTKAPRTIDEFKEMALAIGKLGKDEKGNKIWGTNLAGLENEVHIPFLFSPWLYNMGGNFFDQTTGKATINSKEAVAAVQMFKDLYDEGVFGPVPVARDVNRQVFVQGDVGMIGEGPWQRGLFRDLSGKGEAYDKEWWLDTYPTIDGSPGKSLMWSSNAAIMKGAKHPKEAAKVIEMWVSDPEVVLAYGELNGGIPAVKSIQSLQEVQNDAYRKVFVDEILAGGNLPFAPHATKITELSGLFSKAFLDIILNDAPIQETLDKLNADMDSVVAAK
ncbi:MAG: sugar ABC transporter substrate-binding protein [Actinobacteria bacterium]|nr:sugar ABC transporter substrate-binding protein [Actinomycetota bacterium]